MLRKLVCCASLLLSSEDISWQKWFVNPIFNLICDIYYRGEKKRFANFAKLQPGRILQDRAEKLSRERKKYKYAGKYEG